MYKKFPEFQTLRTRLYAVFTGKIIQREPCAGCLRPRGSPHRAPSPKGAPRAARKPDAPKCGQPADSTSREHGPMPHATPRPAAPPRATPQPPSGRRRFPFPGSTSSAFLANAASGPQAGGRIRRFGHPPPKKKGAPGPRDADISPNTPPEANQAPRAGPPRGCAPWRRGARGQGSSR